MIKQISTYLHSFMQQSKIRIALLLDKFILLDKDIQTQEYENFCKSVLSGHNFINNRCVKLKSSAMRKTRLAPKKKITQLFFLHFPHMFCYNIYPLFCTPINYVTCFRRKQLTLYYYVETKGWHSIRSLQILRLNLYQ